MLKIDINKPGFRGREIITLKGFIHWLNALCRESQIPPIQFVRSGKHYYEKSDKTLGRVAIVGEFPHLLQYLTFYQDTISQDIGIAKGLDREQYIDALLEKLAVDTFLIPNVVENVREIYRYRISQLVENP